MCTYPGLLEFVCGRQTETQRDGMDWKFAIVREWVKGGEEGAGGAAGHRKLTSYIREGPYYMDRHPQVATAQA